MNAMIRHFLLMAALLALISACTKEQPAHRTVICIPVYGQSLALGEEAQRLTDFDSLAAYADGRIVTELLDHEFGYFDNSDTKLWVKKMIAYQKRSYELSVYQMAKCLAEQLGNDTLICIFPGGQGGTALADLSKGTEPYEKFISRIETAYQTAQDYGWDFRLPAVCWMQGESDIADYPEGDYRQRLTQIRKDMDDDIRRITHQQDTIRFICYQPNALTRAPQFRADSNPCHEAAIPQAFVNLLQEDSLFWASGPTYPYACVNEIIHIDAEGQQAIGKLAARSALGILRGTERFRGLIPAALETVADTLIIRFTSTGSPLTFDTLQVNKAPNYGFSVISKACKDIATEVWIDSTNDTKHTTDNIKSTAAVKIRCSETPANCSVRYAVNGDYMKSGNQHGPRGNLRDASGNWCYQFIIEHDAQH